MSHIDIIRDECTQIAMQDRKKQRDKMFWSD